MYTVQNTRVNHVKIDRLIGIITILLQQDKITVPELAARFEVSRRTINRDIEDIRAMEAAFPSRRVTKSTDPCLQKRSCC